MTTNRLHPQKRATTALLVATLLCLSSTVHGEEREDLEKLRATVLGLVDALVASGVLPRDRADAMMLEAEARATIRLAQAPPPELGPDGKKVVRVPYVSETIKRQMREQIKSEVLAQAKTENWAGVGAGSAEWNDRIQIEGALRVRAEPTLLGKSNTPAVAYSNANSTLTRAADILGSTGAGGVHNFNTEENSLRTRVRAQFSLTAKITDGVTAGIALSTGGITGPSSTNQTLGQGFNKYSAVVDRAFIKLDPAPWLSASGGRIRNPFFGTDLLWSDDLNFEGFAVTFKPKVSDSTTAFLTAGWFPLSVNSPGQSKARSLIGVQAGFGWKLLQTENKFTFGAAVYEFRGIEGQAETAAAFGTAPDYVTRSEYSGNFRQRGNTLFRINAPSVGANPDTATNWGLASRFRELDLTAALDVAQFDPVHVILTGDMVKNFGFKRDEIALRTGSKIMDGKSIGFLAKMQVGTPVVAKAGDWNVSLAYRYLGSDAVLDAFTTSDFGLGGTNNKGTILGVNYGFAKNTWLTARWLSSNQIDSFVPATSSTSLNTKLSTDVFQLDLNTRF